MKTITKYALVFAFLIGFGSYTFAQKTVSIGVKAGFPNLIGASTELNLPLLDNRFSIYGDLSKINRDLSAELGEDVMVDFNYTEFGANYYLFSAGKGLYVGAGIGNFKLDATLSNIDLENGSTGSGATTLSFSTKNVKLGIRTGGMVYVRLEAGRGFGDIPTALVVTVRSSDGYQETVTEDFENELKDLPGFSESGIAVLNFGIGFAF